MTAASAADILIAATDVDDRLLECLADCRATFVRTFEEAQRALREQLFKMIVIDLNFDNVRMFDLIQHVRSLADFNGVPVLCVQGAEAGAGFSAALDRLVRMLGGKAFIDLRGDEESLAGAFQRLCSILGAELGIDSARRWRQQSQRSTARLRAGDRPLCVLIVDHDVGAADGLGEIVEHAGHDVDFAYNGIAGLDAARRLRPDVVFVDVSLPRPDGYELARRFRREPGLRTALLIALISTAHKEDLERVREAGFDDYVVKPADRQSIQRLLDPHLSEPASAKRH